MSRVRRPELRRPSALLPAPRPPAVAHRRFARLPPEEAAEVRRIHIAPYREDGETPGTPTWIWCVAVDGELYVQGYHGRDSSWYQAAVREEAGEITAAGPSTYGIT